MKLIHYSHPTPFMFEGEEGGYQSSFSIGGKAGSYLITDIEATPMGIVVRRPDGPWDVLLAYGGGGGRIYRQQAKEPAQLKEARK